MWFVLLVVTGLIFAAYSYLTWNYEYWQTRGVLAPKPKLVFGNFSESGKRKCHATDEFTRLYDDYKGIANFVGIYQMRTPRVLVLEPQLAKEILVKNFKNFRDNEFSKMFDFKHDPLFSRNPFLSRGDEWKERRTEISPAFSSNRIKSLYPIIDKVCQKLTDYIRDNLANPFEAGDLSGKFTAEAVSNCIFGIEANCFQREDSELRKMSKSLFKPSILSLISIFVTSIEPRLKTIFKVQFIPDDVNAFFVNLIEQSVDYRVKHKIAREDYLDYLITLQKKKGFSSLDLAGHSISFFSDGLETSSIAIAHTLYELASNGNVQDKLRKEIDDYIDKHGEMTFEALNDLPYLDQVMQESLRMHPPFPAISKECTEEIDLEYRKGQTITIEKGINVYLPLYQFQRDPEFYPKPNEFIPERFDAEFGGVKASKDKGVFLTFGDGPRFCLGMKFAMFQSKAAVYEVIKNFKITVNEKTAKKLIFDPTEFMNVKKGGLWLNFKPAKMFEL